MMLAQLIAAHEARQPRPIGGPNAALTPLGDACAAVNRVRRQVGVLSAADRLWIAKRLQAPRRGRRARHRLARSRRPLSRH